MKRFTTRQPQKSCKLKDNCVELSTCVAVGGGGNLELIPQGFRRVFKILVSGQAARLGFTLAEVLITLGIIGVVAAMTMPSLITKYQKQVAVEQYKKIYSILKNAELRAVLD